MPPHDEAPPAFRNVGRGGAGNHHPASKTVPAQELVQAPTAPAAPSRHPLQDAPPQRTRHSDHPVRAGRGGAGNFFDPQPPTIGHDRQQQASAVDETVALRRDRQRSAMGGRGGSGNWTTSSTSAEDAVGTAVEDAVEALEKKVKEVVDKGLKMPDQVHHRRGSANEPC
ncbi:hypothetical protein DCS_01299 [Drechmeria coniospora]|uniref:Uncharacterized protein n=1 Tax=Drechmeria coniospora TaxID=98403 RepID=A0A151GSR6_DRECN|nr:hypothetical protein DCS_01299 [Drechmeria coniospora]KYK60164.1 hypothetical protein DCS_01299 [Drechmeria coniospora]ODA80108.1 hypothetical protein RJ55_03066 [Drechmeria coniospora]